MLYRYHRLSDLEREVLQLYDAGITEFRAVFEVISKTNKIGYKTLNEILFGLRHQMYLPYDDPRIRDKELRFLQLYNFGLSIGHIADDMEIGVADMQRCIDNLKKSRYALVEHVTLNERQHEILKCYLRGQSKSTIAKMFMLSDLGVDRQLARLRAKGFITNDEPVGCRILKSVLDGVNQGFGTKKIAETFGVPKEQVYWCFQELVYQGYIKRNKYVYKKVPRIYSDTQETTLASIV